MTILTIAQRHNEGGTNGGGHGNTNIAQHEVIPVRTLSSISPSISPIVPTNSIISNPATPPSGIISPRSPQLGDSAPTTESAPAQPTGPPAGGACPTGTSWYVFEDTMAWHNATSWSLDGADESRVDFKDGMTVAIDQSYIYAELVTKDKWVAPVTIEADLKAAGVGGVPTTFVLKDNAVGGLEVGEEIDLEITAYDDAGKKAPSYQMQLPIWKPPTGSAEQAIKLVKSKAEKDGIELLERLYNTFFEDSVNPSMPEWAYSYPGFDAREWVRYKSDWSAKSIDWYTQGVQRVSFENEKDESFPHTPLSFRTGLWAVSKVSENVDGWAGAVQWEKNPKPAMSIKNVKITGCRQANK